MKFTRLLSVLCMAALMGCDAPLEEKEGTGHVVLKPLAEPAAYTPRVRQIVYVPAYSAIYWGFDQQVADLAVTLSIRNVNLQQSIVVHSAKYYGSEGDEIRNFVGSPSELPPMATADFVIQRRDTSGGTGASFLVEWSTDRDDVDEPVVETVMTGQHGNAGISFTGLGRVLPKASAASNR